MIKLLSVAHVSVSGGSSLSGAHVSVLDNSSAGFGAAVNDVENVVEAVEETAAVTVVVVVAWLRLSKTGG